MLNVLQNITITQRPTEDFPIRSAQFIFDFVNEIEIRSSWEIMTDTAHVVLPKKLYFKNKQGQSVTFEGKNLISVNNDVPTIQRGDKIKIELGYLYPSDNGKGYTTEMNTEFEGFISKVRDDYPLELTCEDNMWLLKQTKIENKLYLGSQYTMETMLKDVVAQVNKKHGTNLTVNVDNVKSKIGDFRTEFNPTAAQILDDLKRHYSMICYFRGDELRVGILKYYPSERREHVFHFQKNIIDDQLDYCRKDDVRIGVKIVGKTVVVTDKLNKNGSFKTKEKTIEGFAGDKDGEIRTLHFYENDEDELQKIAEKMLPKLKFEGYRGNLTTFGLPSVRHGDSAMLIDEILGRDGEYLVKGTTKKVTMNGGFRQVLDIDLRLDVLSSKEQKELL